MLEQIFYRIAARHAAVCLALLPGSPVVGRHRLNRTFDLRSSVDFRCGSLFQPRSEARGSRRLPSQRQLDPVQDRDLNKNIDRVGHYSYSNVAA